MAQSHISTHIKTKSVRSSTSQLQVYCVLVIPAKKTRFFIYTHSLDLDLDLAALHHDHDHDHVDMIGCTMMSFSFTYWYWYLANSSLISADITSWIGVSCQYQYQYRYINISTFTRAAWYNGSNLPGATYDEKPVSVTAAHPSHISTHVSQFVAHTALVLRIGDSSKNKVFHLYALEERV
jgi:hypothetical protein